MMRYIISAGMVLAICCESLPAQQQQAVQSQQVVQPEPKKRQLDKTKRAIEIVTEALVANEAAEAVIVRKDQTKKDIELPAKNVARDVTKELVIERPTEHIVNNASAAENSVESDSANTNANPKVKPGDVAWHADFEAACRAAKKSGKPVLLFQMMGNLDDRFC